MRLIAWRAVNWSHFAFAPTAPHSTSSYLEHHKAHSSACASEAFKRITTENVQDEPHKSKACARQTIQKHCLNDGRQWKSIAWAHDQWRLPKAGLRLGGGLPLPQSFHPPRDRGPPARAPTASVKLYERREHLQQNPRDISPPPVHLRPVGLRLVPRCCWAPGEHPQALSVRRNASSLPRLPIWRCGSGLLGDLVHPPAQGRASPTQVVPMDPSILSVPELQGEPQPAWTDTHPHLLIHVVTGTHLAAVLNHYLFCPWWYKE